MFKSRAPFDPSGEVENESTTKASSSAPGRRTKSDNGAQSSQPSSLRKVVQQSPQVTNAPPVVVAPVTDLLDTDFFSPAVPPVVPSSRIDSPDFGNFVEASGSTPSAQSLSVDFSSFGITESNNNLNSGKPSIDYGNLNIFGDFTSAASNSITTNSSTSQVYFPTIDPNPIPLLTPAVPMSSPNQVQGMQGGMNSGYNTGMNMVIQPNMHMMGARTSGAVNGGIGMGMGMGMMGQTMGQTIGMNCMQQPMGSMSQMHYINPNPGMVGAMPMGGGGVMISSMNGVGRTGSGIMMQQPTVSGMGGMSAARSNSSPSLSYNGNGMSQGSWMGMSSHQSQLPAPMMGSGPGQRTQTNAFDFIGNVMKS